MTSPRNITARQFTAIIENPVGSADIKYETDKNTGRLIVDRFRKAALPYPGNYGFIPETLSGDGDPVDVLVIETTPIHPGIALQVVPIGVLYMEDEHGPDEKIICVPAPALMSDFGGYTEYAALPANIRQAIEHFFTHYKDHELGKWTKMHGIGDAQAALAAIDDGYNRARAQKPAEPKSPQP